MKKLCFTHFQAEERALLEEGTGCQIVPWPECEVCLAWFARDKAAWQVEADKLTAAGYICRDPNAHTPLWDGPEGDTVYLRRNLGSLNWWVEPWRGKR